MTWLCFCAMWNVHKALTMHIAVEMRHDISVSSHILSYTYYDWPHAMVSYLCVLRPFRPSFPHPFFT